MICVESAADCIENCQWPDCMITNEEGRELKKEVDDA